MAELVLLQTKEEVHLIIYIYRPSKKSPPHTSRSALQTRLPFDGANHALWSDGNYDATSSDLEKG